MVNGGPDARLGVPWCEVCGVAVLFIDGAEGLEGVYSEAFSTLYHGKLVECDMKWLFCQHCDK